MTVVGPKLIESSAKIVKSKFIADLLSELYSSSVVVVLLNVDIFSDLKNQRLDLLERELSQTDLISGPNISFVEVSGEMGITFVLSFVLCVGRESDMHLRAGVRHAFDR